MASRATPTTPGWSSCPGCCAPRSAGTSWVTGLPTCGSSPRHERPSSGAQLCALEEADGWRYQLCATNTPRRQLAFLEARHRAHARVEDFVRCGKSTGLAHLPSTSLQINAAWCVAAGIAADLLCWLRLLCLDRSLADAEPKTLRYRILHTAIRLVRGQRKRKIKIPETWPWARELEAAFLAAFALTAPT